MAGLMTFHGPMPVASKLTPYTREGVCESSVRSRRHRDARQPGRPEVASAGAIPCARSGRAWRPARWWVEISILLSLFGTPYEIDTRGAIFFFEDIDEEPYRFGHLLTQLSWPESSTGPPAFSSGAADIGPRDYKPSTVSPYNFADTLDRPWPNFRCRCCAACRSGTPTTKPRSLWARPRAWTRRPRLSPSSDRDRPLIRRAQALSILHDESLRRLRRARAVLTDGLRAKLGSGVAGYREASNAQSCGSGCGRRDSHRAWQAQPQAGVPGAEPRPGGVPRH